VVIRKKIFKGEMNVYSARLPTSLKVSRVSALIMVTVLVLSLLLAVLSAPAMATTHVEKFTGAQWSQFGYSVAISSDGNTAVVGAPDDDPNTRRNGAVYVYTRSDGTWGSPVRLWPDDWQYGYYGQAVAISGDGDTILVGSARGRQEYTGGRAYTFKRNSEGGWDYKARLDHPSGPYASAEFGSAVAIDRTGTTAVVGARDDSSNKGAVYVYALNGAWQWQATFTETINDWSHLGRSVAINEGGNTIVAGAPGHNYNSGLAFVYTKSGVTWSSGVMIAPQEPSYEAFGRSVSISGSTIMVGAPDNNNYCGAAYVFTPDGTGWSQRQKLTPGGTHQEEQFGHAISIRADETAIASIYRDYEHGAVYVYTTSSGTWGLQELIIASDRQRKDYFGSSVGIGSGTVIVGAKGWPNDAGNGAVYIYGSSPATSHIITATAEPNGSITPSGSVNVSHGGNQTFTITPDEGYHITNVLVNGTSLGPITSYTFTNVTSAHTISASFGINTYTITASAGAGGSISPLGEITVNWGVSRTFTITPNTGYHIADVLVDGESVGPVTSYTFTNVTNSHTISAAFINQTYTLDMAVAPAGSGTATDLTGTGPYAEGTLVRIKAEQAAGYIFTGWSSPAGEFADFSAAETTFTMPAQNLTVTANFGVVPTLNVTGAGTFTYDGNPHGVTATATGVEGEMVSGIFEITYRPDSDHTTHTEDPPVNADSYTCFITFLSSDSKYANANTDVRVVITKATPTITVTGGTYTYDGEPHPAVGTATGVDGAAVEGSFLFFYNDITMLEPIDPGTYTVSTTFQCSDTNYNHVTNIPTVTIIITAADPEAYALTITTQGNGTVTADPEPTDGVYSEGTAISLTAVAGTGYRFVGWSGDLTGTENPTSITMNGNKSVTAIFAELITPTLNVTGAGTFTYDGNPHEVTAMATGVEGETVSGTFIITYRPNSTSEYTADPPVNADNYACSIMFLSSDPNYTGANTQVHVTINKATPTIVVTGGTYTYDGQPHGAVGTATGIDGSAVDGFFNFVYNETLFSSPIEPGTYTVTASTFYSYDSNYNYVNSTPAITIIINVPEPEAYTLTITTQGNGTVTADPEPTDGVYSEGTLVSLTAVAAEGWYFTGWSGNLFGTANPATITMDGHKSVTANFAVVPSWPKNIKVSAKSTATTVTLSLSKPVLGAIKYVVYCGTDIGVFDALDGTTFVIDGLTANTSYTFTVQAWYAENVETTDGPSVKVTTKRK
jgi:uncharacterized repeat protein (TIGR02543 family)